MQTQRQAATDPHNRPINWVYKSAYNLLSCTYTITIYYYYPAWKVIFILSFHFIDVGNAVRVHSPCPRLYVTVAVVINTTVCSGIRTCDLAHLRHAVSLDKWHLRLKSVCGNYETTSTIPMSTKQPNTVKILLRQTTACRYVRVQSMLPCLWPTQCSGPWRLGMTWACNMEHLHRQDLSSTTHQTTQCFAHTHLSLYAVPTLWKIWTKSCS